MVVDSVVHSVMDMHTFETVVLDMVVDTVCGTVVLDTVVLDTVVLDMVVDTLVDVCGRYSGGYSHRYDGY